MSPDRQQRRIDALLALAEVHGRRFDRAVRRGDLGAMDVELDNLRDISARLRVEVETRPGVRNIRTK